jgi:hypothetical protein
MEVADPEDLELVRPRRRPRQGATRRFGLVEDRAFRHVIPHGVALSPRCWFEAH